MVVDDAASTDAITLALFTEIHSSSNQIIEVIVLPTVTVRLVAVPGAKNHANWRVVVGDVPSENRGVPLAVNVPDAVRLTQT
jgi:hypothetical protein